MQRGCVGEATSSGVLSLRSATPGAYRPCPLGFHGGFMMLARLFPSSASGDQQKGQGGAEAPPSSHIAGPPGKAPIGKPMQSGLAGSEDGTDTQGTPRASSAPVRCHPPGVSLRSGSSAPGLAMGWAEIKWAEHHSPGRGRALPCVSRLREGARSVGTSIAEPGFPGQTVAVPHGPGLLKMPPTAYILHPQTPRATALCPGERPCGWSSF